MPPRPRRTSFARSRRTGRRKLVWAQRTVSANAAANGQWCVFDLLQEYKAAVGNTTAGITVMRTHLWVLPHAPAAGDIFWVGLRVSDLADVTVAGFQNNALVSNPRDNPYVDWAFNQRFEFDVNLRTPTMNTSFAGAVLDLRSKRRMEEIQEAWTCTVLQDTVGTVAKQYEVFSRTLLALP